MWGAGTHLVIRLIEVLAVIFAVPLVYLYTQYQFVGALAVLGTYGLSIIGLFATTWDKINKPLTERLNYLNIHAFSPLAEASRYNMGYNLVLDLRTSSNAVSALQSQKRYLSVRIYPKKLLSLTEELARNSKEYEPLFYEINGDNEEWIKEHATWKQFGASPDMVAVNSALGITGPTLLRPPEFGVLVREFVDSLKDKKGKMVERFVTLSKEIQKEKEAISTILDSYMRSNMLHVLSRSGPFG